MIYVSDLQQLISQWTDRMDNYAHPSSYKDALAECAYELSQLVNKALLDEMTEKDAKEYLSSQEADSYLSSMEAHGYATAV